MEETTIKAATCSSFSHLLCFVIVLCSMNNKIQDLKIQISKNVQISSFEENEENFQPFFSIFVVTITLY